MQTTPVPDLIARAQSRHGMTGATLAAHIGISGAHLSSARHGRYRLSADVTDRLAALANAEPAAAPPDLFEAATTAPAAPAPATTREPPADNTGFVDIAATARAALDCAESVLSAWLPEGKRQGPEWVSRNPTRHDTKLGSFLVNITTGAWSDFATNDRGGDLVSLVRYLDGLPTQGEAARKLASWLGIAPTDHPATRHNGTERPAASPTRKTAATHAPIPSEALAARPEAHPTLGRPIATWAYRDTAGRPIAFVCRFDLPGGDKTYRPLTHGPDGWTWTAPPEPRPLYGLDRLAARPDAPAILTEGEKAADAAAALMPDCVTVTTMNGAQSPQKADWSPFNGRVVRIWPDADAPGAAYAETAARLATEAGAAAVEILDLSSLAMDPSTGEVRNLPAGWDAADAAADGWTPETLAGAARWNPHIGPDTATPPATTPSPDAWPAPRPLPERGDMAEAAAFPLDLLPAPLRDAAREVSRFCKAPEASAALVGIGALATAIGKRAMIEERPGLLHYPALFLVGIAASGERKSPVFRAMARPLEDWTEAQAEAWEADARRARARNAAIDAAVAKVKKQAGSDVDAATREIEELDAKREEIPPYPRLFTTDCTEQRLFQLMHERGGAFAVLSAEGRPVVDAINGKYSGDGRTGDAIYLAGVSGDAITRDRVGGEGGPEDRVISRPCLSVCILIQPDKFLEAAAHPALRSSGALARIWPVWLPSLVGTRIEAPDEAGLSGEAMAPFNALIRRLLSHNPPEDEDGRPAPHRATLSPAAAEARRLYHNAIEQLMGEGGELSDVRDIAAKAVSQTAKLALVLHLAADAEILSRPASAIDAATWATAQAIGTWFFEEAVRVQRLADEDPALDAARRVIRWLAAERRQTVNTTDLMQTGPRPRPKAREAIATLDLLEDFGWVRAQTEPPKRRPIYLVHPKLATLAKLAGKAL
ncbi:DUF3987 domain-containing protein [Thiocapsa roseopersicina]|uniref:DUF3987 domain-containing protein n=1 Tax=Thiocapsa roseopersicina TaxID=1058 RepID=A0A1H3BZM1_THIRO|nr:DUF3987 domain-containing protein [Thiocapsa roseopersicina]SDX47148.1 Protein of unknown function [Thiocapsa roseopersicina]